MDDTERAAEDELSTSCTLATAFIVGANVTSVLEGEYICVTMNGSGHLRRFTIDKQASAALA